LSGRTGKPGLLRLLTKRRLTIGLLLAKRRLTKLFRRLGESTRRRLLRSAGDPRLLLRWRGHCRTTVLAIVGHRLARLDHLRRFGRLRRRLLTRPHDLCRLRRTLLLRWLLARPDNLCRAGTSQCRIAALRLLWWLAALP